jgi:uncharacterized protein YprB with RNaseH-like and TPR domain
MESKKLKTEKAIIHLTFLQKKQANNMIVNNIETYDAALEFIQQNDLLAYDIETDGLNMRKNVIIGIGISNATQGYYFPLKTWNGQSLQDVELPGSIKAVLYELKSKKLITFNGAFDIPFTKINLGVDLLDALYCDVMLLKHTCDEEFPFDLKGVGEKIFGLNAKEEQEVLKEHLKAKGAGAKEYYKADTNILAKYCIKDCLLTYKLFDYYMADMERQSGL